MRTWIVLLTFAILVPTTTHAFGKRPVEPDPKPTPTPSPAPAPNPDIIRARWEASQRDGALWSRHVFAQLPVLAPNLLAKVPADIASFCPAYSRQSAQDQKNFWVYLLSSMTEFESGHRPEVTYTESFPDSQGRPVISRGLLQLSIESGNAYGCRFANAEEVHEPLRNLDCGLRILNRWIGRDGVIARKAESGWQGGARYWSVLRSSGTKLARIQGFTKQLRICAE